MHTPPPTPTLHGANSNLANEEALPGELWVLETNLVGEEKVQLAGKRVEGSSWLGGAAVPALSPDGNSKPRRKRERAASVIN